MSIFKKKTVTTEERRVERLLTHGGSFASEEAFRNLKLSLTVSMPRTNKDEGVAVLLTSAYPADGKTTVAVNLALTLAASNAKVVLVDADIRKGRTARFFREKTGVGLADCLSGLTTLDEAIRPTTECDGLSYISCGTHSPRPYELLESEAMRNLIGELKKRFDYVVIDTPPVLPVADALAIAPHVDGTILVCRHERTYLSDISRSIDKLRFAKANLLGVVVNDFKARKVLGKRYEQYSYYESDARKGEND